MDLIDIQAAIDVLEKEKPTPFVNKDGSIDPFGAGQQNQWYRDGIAIMNLPFVQSDVTDINVGNTIYRQAAIDTVRKCSVKEVTPAYMLIDKAEVMTELMMLPPVQPERIRGKWIHDGYDIPHGVDWMHCSVCGRREPYVPAAMTSYCPSCGADMRGGQE